MKPRYAVVDKEERDKFEREYQMPYGYGNVPIYFDLQEAVEARKSLVQEDVIIRKYIQAQFDDNYIIEEYDNGRVKEIVL
jgi:hypothetical protein